MMNVSQAYISKLEKMETVSINNTPLSAFGGFSSQEGNILLEDMYYEIPLLRRGIRRSRGVGGEGR
ncbi:MAG: hypothetical protein H8E85_03085 [Candidatus Marinimicrobia bacterium]|nr:hypothetical protein [Candidatus Neomarinimicrobiota bacterium]